jgi:hypothetical protein
VGFLSTSGQTVGYYLDLAHDLFFQNPSSFIYRPVVRHLCLATDSVANSEIPHQKEREKKLHYGSALTTARSPVHLEKVMDEHLNVLKIVYEVIKYSQ